MHFYNNNKKQYNEIKKGKVKKMFLLFCQNTEVLIVLKAPFEMLYI